MEECNVYSRRRLSPRDLRLLSRARGRRIGVLAGVTSLHPPRIIKVPSPEAMVNSWGNISDSSPLFFGSLVAPKADPPPPPSDYKSSIPGGDVPRVGALWSLVHSAFLQPREPAPVGNACSSIHLQEVHELQELGASYAFCIFCTLCIHKSKKLWVDIPSML